MVKLEGPRKLIAKLRRVAESLTDLAARERLLTTADEFEMRFVGMAELSKRRKLRIQWGS